MVETPVHLILEAIRSEFGVHVGTKVPTGKRDVFIRVDPGSSKPLSPVSDETLVTVQVYGLKLDRVIDLAFSVRRFLTDRISRVDDNILWWAEQSGPQSFPDPDRPDYSRWQIVGTLTTSFM